MTVAHPHVGMVIPVWYPAEAAPGLVETLLSHTLDGTEQYCSPEDVVLVLDGQACWEKVVQTEAAARGHNYHALATNQGKGAAVAAGIAALASTGLRFLVTRDADGAHLISDLPALVDLAELMEAETGNDLLLVTGGRRDRVRPLGFARAEYEQVTDRVLWQALQYHAARAGRIIRETYFAPHDDWPDLQSGYKVYSAAAARLAAQVLRAAGQGRPDGGLARCGVETLPAVAILSGGGEIGQVTRHTSQAPPVSGYRDMDPLPMYAEPLLWALRYLQIPGDVAAVMLDDALLRSRLLFDASRRDQVLAVRTAVLAGMGVTQPLRLGARFF